MKKAIVLLTVFLCVFTFAACSKKTGSADTAGKSANASKTDVIVFAAASLRESMTAIKENYEKSNNVNIVYTFDSSGTLRTQLIAGADCDIFVSAALKQMNDITAGKNDKGADLADTSTIFNYLENKVVLAVNDNNPANIKGFSDLANRLKNGGKVLLAIGNSDVPVGAYTKKIFKYFDIDEDAVASSLTYGTNVKEVTSQVISGAADCGIIYQTDAFSAGLKAVEWATADMCGQVIYPACILKGSKNRAEAEKFFKYLKSKEALKELEKVGFVSAF
ncbi:MAG TPA: molybdate ABC transporter substrate-binding protein [Spirochaetaceae bacterium]|nr:molybdate ABC transporter substrate-binding protein [Spirochaetaceae bacterium]